MPEPPALSWRHWTRFIGPGIVMMGIQIGGGEWLFGPEVTARYGGGLMWIATVAIIFQVFTTWNAAGTPSIAASRSSRASCGTRPGPRFWIGVDSAFEPGGVDSRTLDTCRGDDWRR